MDSVDTFWQDLAMLDWQVELGADEAIGEAPVDRYALEPAAPKPQPQPDAAAKTKQAPPIPPKAPEIDRVAEARNAAGAARDIPALSAALEAFAHCDLKRGARKCVFARGNPAARLMVIGEVPTRAEDAAGYPFSGAEGELLAKMLAAIDLDVEAEDAGKAAYLAAAMPWRVPGEGVPQPKDMAMMTPFLERHITLANPDVLILMGNTACQMLLGRGGITRLRGKWAEALGRPAMPMAHPANLMKTPLAKRDAWADLLDIKAKLKELT